MSVWPESSSGTMATQALAVRSRFRIKTARLCGSPEGLKSEAEHVSECVSEWHRPHQYCVCVLAAVLSSMPALLCLQTVSLAAACWME